MTITSEVREQLFRDRSNVIRLAPRNARDLRSTVSSQQGSSGFGMASRARETPETTRGKLWTYEEHMRFICGLEQYPEGPWRRIAEVVGTRNYRQVMSHAQKYRLKIQRRLGSQQADIGSATDWTLPANREAIDMAEDLDVQGSEQLQLQDARQSAATPLGSSNALELSSDCQDAEHEIDQALNSLFDRPTIDCAEPGLTDQPTLNVKDASSPLQLIADGHIEVATDIIEFLREDSSS